MPSLNDDLSEILADCLLDPNPFDAFNEIVLDRPAYWSAQREICAAVADPTVTNIVVPAGHSVGKSYSDAGIILGWQHLCLDSLVMTTSPSNTQLDGVLWKEIRKARNHAPLISGAGRLTKLPNHLDLGDGWSAYGFSTNLAERLQGFHAAGGPLLNVVDEASGILNPDIWATLKSLKPAKTLMTGNPLHAYGHFYETCKRAEDDPSVRLIRIPSTSSPDIHLETSPRGLADAAWLREMIADYGVDSQTYRVRVLAEFPESGDDILIPKAWLDRAEKAEHVPGGPRRLSIDVAVCNGGDNAVLTVRDDNGVIDFSVGNRGGFEWQAAEAARLAHRYSIDPSRITFDENGPGADFAARLHWAGLVGCKGYSGNRSSRSTKWVNLRSACHWMLRRRLDPSRLDDLNRAIPAFSIPPEYMKRLRFELKEVTYDTKRGPIFVRDGDELRAALRSSPNHLDSLTQSFMNSN